jgi:hypothetical protein
VARDGRRLPLGSLGLAGIAALAAIATLVAGSVTGLMDPGRAVAPLAGLPGVGEIPGIETILPEETPEATAPGGATSSAPATPQPAGAAATPAPGATTAPGTTSTAPGTPATTSPTTTTTTAPAPGQLTIRPGKVGLGSTDRSATITVANTGGRGLEWAADIAGAGLAVTPAAGKLAPGESAALTVVLARADLPEGDVTGTLTVLDRTNGAATRVLISGSVEHPPVLTRPGTKPSQVSVQARGCSGMTTAFVTVSDESGVTVTAAWKGGSATLSGTANGTYSASIGPFTATGTHAVVFTATDKRGNTAQAKTSVDVVPCG